MSCTLICQITIKTKTIVQKIASNTQKIASNTQKFEKNSSQFGLKNNFTTV